MTTIFGNPNSALLSPCGPVSYRPVPGYPGYRAGDDGSIWSCRTSHATLGNTWHRLKLRPDKDGYPTVVLCLSGKRTTRRAAHVILEAFVGPRPIGCESCHFPDTSPANIRPDNLRWATHQENISDKVTLGTQARGRSHGMVRLTEEDVLHLRRVREEKGLGYKRLGRLFNISSNQARLIVKRRNWRHL